jgi:sugar phosphate isomerase/epimerase
MPGLPLDEEMATVRAAGFDGVELFIPKLAPFLERHGVAGLAQRLQELGLRPLSMNGIENVSFRPPREFAQVRGVPVVGGAVHQVGCPTIVAVPSPTPRTLLASIKAQTVDALRELADVAAPYGVQIAFEFLAPATCSVRTLAQAWEIVQAAGRANLGLVLDTYHLIVGGSRWESLETVPVERMLIVHINDEDSPFDR